MAQQVRWVLILLALCGFCANARADGKMLLARCEQAERLLNDQPIEDPVNGSFCLGYVGAMENALRILNSRLQARHRMCMPKNGIEVGQAIRIVLRFLRDNTHRLAENDAALVIEALRAAYPCK